MTRATPGAVQVGSQPPRWRFNELPRWMNKSDPVESEFFTGEGQPDALVRETIQNSLDARHDDSDEVHVRFAIVDSPSGAVRPFLQDLEPHLKKQEFVDEIPQGAKTRCLIIEDRGTRGLVGDPLQDEDDGTESEGEKNDFYWFYRNTGRSKKSESDLGRWGLGKRVLTTSSRVFSFIGLTRRADDRRLLMGLSVLKVHRLGGVERYPYGYFGYFEEDGFALPVEDDELIEAFEETFQLDRSSPGLSLVIPWPKEELTAQQLLKSVVNHYFYPIIRGRLSVTVEGGGDRIVVSKNSLTEIVEVIQWDNSQQRERVHSLVRFVRKAQAVQEAGAFEELERVGADGAPYWRAEIFDSLDRESLRDRFSSGDLVSFVAPIVVRKKEEDPVTSRIEIYLQRDEALTKGEITYVRQGITISDVRGRARPGVRALVVAEDPPIGELLGDSENPAHTEWRERSDRVKRDFDNGAWTVRYVINSPRECIDELTRVSAGRDHNLLKDIFFVPEPPEPEVPDEEDEDDDETTEKIEVEVPSRPASFRISKIESGFSIVGTGKVSLPADLVVRTAYETRKGNPFKQYDPLDFRLEAPPIEIGVRACDLLIREANRLRIRLREPDFRVEVKGFDPNRDLRVYADIDRSGG